MLKMLACGGMKKFVLVMLCAMQYLWASCSGDCASCHAKLDFKNDKRHKSMTECKTCHTEQKMANIDMGGCGQDCFACHDVEKIRLPELRSAHKVIDDCMNCHIGLSNSVFKPNFDGAKSIFDRRNFENFSNGLEIIK